MILILIVRPEYKAYRSDWRFLEMFESKKKKKNRYLIVIGESNIVQKQISIFTYIELFLYAIIFETVQILRICVLKDLLEISKIERPKYSKNSTGFYLHIVSFCHFLEA